MLAYGVAADATEEYHSLGENILMEAMKWFPIPYFPFSLFNSMYLHQPTSVNLEKQMMTSEVSMFAFIECMHYQWKKCFMAWQCQFKDKYGKEHLL